MIWIYADEACLGNQFKDRDRPAGAGGVVEAWHKGQWMRRDFWVSSPDATNNQMAILSAITPLSLLAKSTDVVFTSDSNYLVRGASEWISGWAGRGWRKAGSGGKPGDRVENAELWQQLLDVAGRHRVEWRWVKGHATHAQNCYADHLATRAAREQTFSDGFVESAFSIYLEAERAAGRLLHFDADAPPTSHVFTPVSMPAAG